MGAAASYGPALAPSWEARSALLDQLDAGVVAIAYGADQDESDPEVVYRLDLDEPTAVRANAGEEHAALDVLDDPWTWPFIGSLPWDGRWSSNR